MHNLQSPSTPSLPSTAGESEVKKIFRLSDGKIIYQTIQGGSSSKCHHDSKEWFGCNLCKRWFESMPRLEDHYDRKHEEASSYQFELLELKNCAIELPFILPSSIILPERIAIKEHCDDKDAVASEKIQSKTAYDDASDADININMNLSALTLSPEIQRKVSMKKAIRQAIKAMQVNGSGSSYKRIKAYLVNKAGMDADKLNKKLRKVLEWFVECNRLKRSFSKGKTVYSLPSAKSRHGRGIGFKIPEKETRRFRDHQLKQLAKSLRPHGLLPHE